MKCYQENCLRKNHVPWYNQQPHVEVIHGLEGQDSQQADQEGSVQGPTL